MKIEEITVQDRSVSPMSGAYSATILMRSAGSYLCLRACALAEDARPDTVTRALVHDAIRQLRRMPEYRTGAQVITIADSAWPAPTAQA